MDLDWILLFVLISSDCGIFGANLTSNFYQTEEQSNITFTWDSEKKTDLSQANLVCFFKSSPKKFMYELKAGVELPDLQDEQFSGRVHVDKDALRRGQIRLHVSTVTAEDSGRYWCDLVANYDKKKKKWEIMTTICFILNVSLKAQQEISVSPVTSVAAGTKLDKTQQGDVWIKVIAGIVGVVFLVYLIKTIYLRSKRKDHERKNREIVTESLMNLLLEVNINRDWLSTETLSETV